jgi:hypothetical protein
MAKGIQRLDARGIMPDLLLPTSKVRRIVDNLFQRLACPLVVAIECGVIDRVENSFRVCIIG